MAWSLDEVHAFFEDNERPLSAFGNEMSLPWGWQVSAIPTSKLGQPSNGEGLDDTDEFIDDDDIWQITLSNKNQPGKLFVGTAQWAHGDNPKVLTVDRNDFGVNDELARHIIFAAYWVSDEVHHGVPGQVDIDPGDMFHLNAAEMEMMKYLNDPEHYAKNNNPEKLGSGGIPPGWGKIGTRTESSQSIKVNGYICSKMINHDLWLIQGDSYHWPRQVSPNNTDSYLYADPDEVMKTYPDMYIGFLPSVNISDYLEESDQPLTTGGDGLDDVDEFEIDDPEIDLQRMQDAEHLAARAVRDNVFAKFAKLDVPGFELLYAGAKNAVEGDYVKVLRPFVIVGRKPVTEDLDDKDEFTGEQLTLIATTISYDPTKVNIPSAHVIHIAGRIIIDNGYDVGTFIENGRIEKPNEIRIFGRLEISENIMLWIHDAGGQIELHNYNIDIILESPDVLALNRGIDA